MLNYLLNNLTLGTVGISFIIAVFGCAMSLVLTQLALRQTKRRDQLTLVFFAALALGGVGIWSMHFVGMTAYKDEEFSYNAWYTFVSAVTPVVAMFAGLSLLVGSKFSYIRLLTAGTMVGTAVLIMHYLGMAAMNANLSYNMNIVYLSAAIAVVAAIAALWLLVHVSGIFKTLVTALIMSVAVCSVHYTGMAAVTDFELLKNTHYVLRGNFLLLSLIGIVGSTVLILVGLFGVLTFSDPTTNLELTRKPIGGSGEDEPLGQA